MVVSLHLLPVGRDLLKASQGETYSPFPASLGLTHPCASSQWGLGGLHHEQKWGAGAEGPEPRSAEYCRDHSATCLLHSTPHV